MAFDFGIVKSQEREFSCRFNLAMSSNVSASFFFLNQVAKEYILTFVLN